MVRNVCKGPGHSVATAQLHGEGQSVSEGRADWVGSQDLPLGAAACQVCVYSPGKAVPSKMQFGSTEEDRVGEKRLGTWR